MVVLACGPISIESAQEMANVINVRFFALHFQKQGFTNFVLLAIPLESTERDQKAYSSHSA